MSRRGHRPARCPLLGFCRNSFLLVHKDGTAEVCVLVQWTKETVLSSQVSVTNQPFSRHCDFQCSLSLNLDVNWSHQSGGFWPRVIIRPFRSRNQLGDQLIQSVNGKLMIGPCRIFQYEVKRLLQ